jgi:hypothetical protein
MSSLTICFSSSNSSAASALASSVLPTPVGPMNRKLPTGRSPVERPARARSTASATARTASGWPTTRRPSRSRSPSMRDDSSRVSRLTGMPVQRLTMPAGVNEGELR